ncbi:hypothetical protein F53441_2518 [Fusarium austroafricanum]|uniref:Uncharacterized protein n=1 Tax=Fusarium austroafricanum TaxID=2364996 RepID=A0A8H4KSX3_9HYPO|nr:hypothetical protein F53441_2518 [Fusarium austroafricanum]
MANPKAPHWLPNVDPAIYYLFEERRNEPAGTAGVETADVETDEELEISDADSEIAESIQDMDIVDEDDDRQSNVIALDGHEAIESESEDEPEIFIHVEDEAETSDKGDEIEAGDMEVELSLQVHGKVPDSEDMDSNTGPIDPTDWARIRLHDWAGHKTWPLTMATEAAFQEFRLAGAPINVPKRKSLKTTPRAALKAAEAYLNGGYHREDPTQHFTSLLPSHAKVLACRFVTSHNHFDTVIGGCLSACRRQHLSVVPDSLIQEGENDTVAKINELQNQLNTKDEKVKQLLRIVDLKERMIKIQEERINIKQQMIDVLKEEESEFDTETETP